MGKFFHCLASYCDCFIYKAGLMLGWSEKQIFTSVKKGALHICYSVFPTPPAMWSCKNGVLRVSFFRSNGCQFLHRAIYETFQITKNLHIRKSSPYSKLKVSLFYLLIPGRGSYFKFCQHLNVTQRTNSRRRMSCLCPVCQLD